jgi:hypothetical protein
MKIVYHIPSEWERFQTRIGRLSIDDVSNIVASNRTRELYGQTENTIVFTVYSPRMVLTV